MVLGRRKRVNRSQKVKDAQHFRDHLMCKETEAPGGEGAGLKPVSRSVLFSARIYVCFAPGCI